MHSEVYEWNAEDKINPILEDIITIHKESWGLTGGKVNPRTFVRTFVDVLDTIQQNKSSFKDSQAILKLFDKRDDMFEENFDDNW